jgi:hypothetical protein
MAAGTIREPFAVINADDFYGARSYQLLAEHLRSGTQDYAMVGFILKNTLSEHGSVARGVCDSTADHYLKSVVEMTGIVPDGAGAKQAMPDGTVHRLTGEEVVSMNMWGFNPSLFGHLEREFATFLGNHGTELKSEFFIPSVAGSLLQQGVARIKVLRTTAAWFGVTYQQDRPYVVESVRRLISEGVYPASLRATP